MKAQVADMRTPNTSWRKKKAAHSICVFISHTEIVRRGVQRALLEISIYTAVGKMVLKVYQTLIAFNHTAIFSVTVLHPGSNMPSTTAAGLTAKCKTETHCCLSMTAALLRCIKAETRRIICLSEKFDFRYFLSRRLNDLIAAIVWGGQQHGGKRIVMQSHKGCASSWNVRKSLRLLLPSANILHNPSHSLHSPKGYNRWYMDEINK